jgi:hypothetical protein
MDGKMEKIIPEMFPYLILDFDSIYIKAIFSEKLKFYHEDSIFLVEACIGNLNQLILKIV